MIQRQPSDLRALEAAVRTAENDKSRTKMLKRIGSNSVVSNAVNVDGYVNHNLRRSSSKVPSLSDRQTGTKAWSQLSDCYNGKVSACDAIAASSSALQRLLSSPPTPIRLPTSFAEPKPQSLRKRSKTSPSFVGEIFDALGLDDKDAASGIKPSFQPLMLPDSGLARGWCNVFFLITVIFVVQATLTQHSGTTEP